MDAKDFTVSGEEFGIWECSDCSLRFTQDVPDEESIGPYYQSEEYISHSNTNKGLISSLYQTVRKITLGQKRSFVRKVSGMEKGSILDIGCGTGEFLGTLKESGWQCRGLEPEESARMQARENFALEVSGPEALFEFEPQSFDVISMWHVLEHVHRLHPYLEKIQESLKVKGTLIIAVPNYRSGDAQHYQNEWAAYDVPRHLYHFSPESMERLVTAHGFSLTLKKLMPFDGFYVSMLSEKYRHDKNKLVSAGWQGLRSLLAAKQNVDSASSVIYVFKKD